MRTPFFRLVMLALVLLLAVGCRTTAKAPVYLIKVDKGDTLASIAVKYDTTWDKIAKLNGIEGGSALRIGQVIRVQPGPGGLVAESGGKSGGLFARRPPQKERVENANANEFGEDDFPDLQHAEPESNASGGHGLFYGADSHGVPGGASGKPGASANPYGMDWPLYGEISSGFGRRHGRFHNGIDIRAKKGTTVLAAGSGVVEFAGRQHGYGRVIIIRHANLKTVYAHLSEVDVRVGSKVARGVAIGATGMSGNSTGPHLHFEIRNLKDQAMDPLSILSKDKLLSANK